VLALVPGLVLVPELGLAPEPEWVQVLELAPVPHSR